MQSKILNIPNHRDVRVTELTAFSSLIIYLSTISGLGSQHCSWVAFDISPIVMSNHGLQSPILLSASLAYSHLAVPLLPLEPRAIAHNWMAWKSKVLFVQVKNILEEEFNAVSQCVLHGFFFSIMFNIFRTWQYSHFLFVFKLPSQNASLFLSPSLPIAVQILMISSIFLTSANISSCLQPFRVVPSRTSKTVSPLFSFRCGSMTLPYNCLLVLICRLCLYSYCVLFLFVFLSENGIWTE